MVCVYAFVRHVDLRSREMQLKSERCKGCFASHHALSEQWRPSKRPGPKTELASGKALACRQAKPLIPVISGVL